MNLKESKESFILLPSLESFWYTLDVLSLFVEEEGGARGQGCYLTEVQL